MIRILTAVLFTLIACCAVAQDCRMVVLFESDGELVDQIYPGTGPLMGHLVLYSDVIDEVSGFEAGLDITPVTSLFVIAVSGPNGFTNFGDTLNLLVGYSTPVPTTDPTILCTFDLVLVSTEYTVICVERDPVVTDGDGNSYTCEGECSEINPPVGVEARSFSAIKGVFGR